MSQKDTKFKYVSGRNVSDTNTISVSNTLNTGTTGSTRFTTDTTGRKSLDGISMQLFHHQLPSRFVDESNPESWPRRTHPKKSSSSKRWRPEAAGSEPRLTTERQDSVELCWSEETYEVEELVEVCRGSLPVIVRVERGYTGGEGSGLDLADNQTLQVFQHGVQSRVSITNSSHQGLSLPLDYPVHITRTETQHSASKQSMQDMTDRLDAVLQVSPPPFTACIVDHAAGTNETTAPVTAGLIGSQVTINSVYNSHFLCAHVIREGWLNTTRPLLIPQELGAVFRVAEGLKGADQDEWEDYRGMFARAVRDARAEKVYGYQCVIYDNWSSCRCDLARSIRFRSNSSNNSSDTELVDDPYLSTLQQSNTRALIHSQQSDKSSVQSNTNQTDRRFQNNLSSSCKRQGAKNVKFPQAESKLTSSSYLNISSPEITQINPSCTHSCIDLSCVERTNRSSSSDFNSCLDLSCQAAKAARRSVPFMGTRDITHKFANCNFNVTSSQVAFSEEVALSGESIRDVLIDVPSDPSATLVSVCYSADDGYDTKESTISSSGSVTYRKQFSPVFF